MSSICSSDSEANASDSLEHLEEMIQFLNKWLYRICHSNSPSLRGIDVIYSAHNAVYSLPVLINNYSEAFSSIFLRKK